MNRAELKKIIRGPVETVPTPFDKDFKIDLPCMADLIQWYIQDGAVKGRCPLKIAAAMGEGPDMSDDEWPAVLRTAVNAADGKVDIICALKTKNTLHTIEDARKAQDLGAVGLQIDLPIFHHPNQDDYVRYFTDISDKIDIGIIIYNTHWFGAESVQADTMLRLKDAEHVTAIKWDVPAPQSYDYMAKFSHIFNVIDNSGQFVRCHRNGGAGFITEAVFPSYDLKVWDLLEAKKYDEVQALVDRDTEAMAKFNAMSAKKSGGYRRIKAMMKLVGRPVGDPRPPTLPCDEAELAELRIALKKIGWPVVA